MRFLLSVILFIVFISAPVSAQDWLWALEIKGKLQAPRFFGHHIEKTSKGNLFMVRSFQDTLMVDKDTLYAPLLETDFPFFAEFSTSGKLITWNILNSDITGTVRGFAVKDDHQLILAGECSTPQ